LRTFEGMPPWETWYCKGVLEFRKENYQKSQNHFARILNEVRRKAWPEDPADQTRAMSQALIGCAQIALQRGQFERMKFLAECVLQHGSSAKASYGVAQMMLGREAEERRDWRNSLQWYNAAQATFLEFHSWYHFLFVMMSFARVSRKQGNLVQARWYLDTLEKAVKGPELKLLRQLVEIERRSLDQKSVDLTLDTEKGMVRLRDGKEVLLKKQFLLLDLLQELSKAHLESESSNVESGLTKKEIIERVWKERYRPEAHDNKLYYNINRLRKILESDSKNPQVVLGWKEGYRLAPGLRIQLFGKGQKIFYSQGSNLAVPTAPQEDTLYPTSSTPVREREIS
jgi:DNA-binding winged helix-turn-helix (wHTH) protein